MWISSYVISSGFSMAIKELWANKLRSTLSLIGVSFGIVCIISVLAIVGSLKKNIKDGFSEMGANTIYIEKWPYSSDDSYPWWKYSKRPHPSYNEINLIKERSSYASKIAFVLPNNSNVLFESNIVTGINCYGVTNQFSQIEHVIIQSGRFISELDFTSYLKLMRK